MIWNFKYIKIGNRRLSFPPEMDNLQDSDSCSSNKEEDWS